MTSIDRHPDGLKKKKGIAQSIERRVFICNERKKEKQRKKQRVGISAQ